MNSNSFLESRTVPELHYNSVLCKTDTFSSLKGSLTVTATAADLGRSQSDHWPPVLGKLVIKR